MEHYNKYYLVRASEFDNRRTKPPPTNPSERVFDAAAEFRKRAQSALTEGTQDGRRRLLPRAPDRPPSLQPAQQQEPTSEERAEGPAGAKATVRSSQSVVWRTPKQQRSARNELCSLLSPVKTGKKGKKKRRKQQRSQSL